jgi:hypothetical protein
MAILAGNVGKCVCRLHPSNDRRFLSVADMSLNTSAVASFAQVNHLGIQSALQVVYL